MFARRRCETSRNRERVRHIAASGRTWRPASESSARTACAVSAPASSGTAPGPATGRCSHRRSVFHETRLNQFGPGQGRPPSRPCRLATAHGTTQPRQELRIRRIDESEHARPVVDEPVSALTQQDTTSRDDRTERVPTRIEMDVAERGVDVGHEVGRREAAVPIVLVALSPIGSLRRPTPRPRREHRQQPQQARHRPAAPLQTCNGRRRQARLRCHLGQR